MKQHMRMQDKIILRLGAKFLVPFILLFAFYVQFHGDFGPGGGFQAGVIAAAAFVLYGLIFGLDTAQKVVPKSWLEKGMAIGVLVYGGTGVATMLLGGNFLEYDVLHHHNGQHYGIIAVEAGVGIAVTCTMTLLYYLFAERGRR